jgi:enoyl-CoA hydratase/carnithine racemase
MPFLLVAKPRPHVTLVTLNRPERMNAMSFGVMIPFRQALEEISRDNDTRVVVVTSTPPRPPVSGWSHRHMRHEAVAQLYVRNLAGNFEEMLKARKDHRTPVYLDDPGQKDG